MQARGGGGEMACDSGPQEPPPPWDAAAVGAPEQPRRPLLPDAPGRGRAARLRLRLLAAVAPDAATTRHALAQLAAAAMLLLRRQCVAAEDAIARTAEGSSEETTVSVLLLPSPAGVGTSTKQPRVQVISSMDSSTVDLQSYLQVRDPQPVRLLAEETREIWEMPCEDVVEECATAIAMLLLVVQEKISAPGSGVVEDISAKGICYHVTTMLQPSGSPRTASLLLQNTGRIFVGCLPFSVDSEYFIEFFSAEFGLVDKAVLILIGLKRGRRIQLQLRSFGFVGFEGQEGLVNARYHRMDVKEAVAGPYFLAELQRNMSLRKFIHQWPKAKNNMLDGELCEKHNIYKWRPLPVQCVPSWFLMSRKWLPLFLVGEAENLEERYPLNDLEEGDSGATYLVELSHGVYGYYDEPKHSLHFLLEPKSELAESKSDYQYPGSPLTTNINGDSHDTESQQLAPCSESNNAESQQGSECRSTNNNVDIHQVGDSTDNDSSVIPIFVRHVSGELALTVSLDQSSEHLMHLYAQKTKKKLECQYFVYRRKTLEPDCALLFYGLERDTTVHVCTRLLGGKHPTLAQYVHDNSNTFTVEVILPDGRISLQMTTEGCQFLSSWIKCFTTAFSRGQSWNGEFTLEDFKYVDGHIGNIERPKKNFPPSSMGKDLIKFVDYVERILCSNQPHLISKYPPYLRKFTNFINNHLLQRLDVTNLLSSEDKLFLETHVCCMTCYARETLVIELFCKYECLDMNEASKWEEAIDGASCPMTWVTDLPMKSWFFTYVIEKGKGKGVHYKNSKTSAFIFLKDTILHATDYATQDANAPHPQPQPGDGIELMIPTHLEDFLPTIILNLIEKKVDISAELLAAVKCACRICDSS